MFVQPAFTHKWELYVQGDGWNARETHCEVMP
jgi:hypothetical protein